MIILANRRICELIEGLPFAALLLNATSALGSFVDERAVKELSITTTLGVLPDLWPVTC